MEYSNDSLGRGQPEMQDETLRQDNGVQAEQQPGQDPSGGSAANAAPAAPIAAQRPSASAVLSPGLTWPPGFAGQIAYYIFDSAPRPVPEVAIVAALGLLSGICGKVWVTPTKTGLNQYLILVARSAIGKDAMHTGIAMLMKEATKDSVLHFGNDFVDFSDFASGQALQKACAANRSFVNVTGEFGHRLRQIATSTNKPDSPMQNLRRVMTNLYSKSGPQAVAGGITYSDKDKNISSVEGVAYSLIGETTPGTFYELLTPDMMADGFMSRFTVVEYEGERPSENEWADYFSTPWRELLDWLKPLLAQSLSLLSNGQTETVQYLQESHAMLKAFSLECDARIRDAGSDESLRQMWNRAHMKALKIACLLAVADNYIHPVITTHHAEWAISFIKRDISVFTRRLQSGDIGMGDDSREAKLISIAREYLSSGELPAFAKDFEPLHRGGVIPRKYLQIRTQKLAAFSNHRSGSTKALDETIRSLIDAGHFMELPKTKVVEDYGFHGKAYLVLALEKIPATNSSNWLDSFSKKAAELKA